MNVVDVLSFARRFTWALNAPDGPRINKILGTIAANYPRIQNDLPAIEAFLQDLLPLIQKHMAFFAELGVVLNKHWKPILASSNDLIPIIEAINQEAKS